MLGPRHLTIPAEIPATNSVRGQLGAALARRDELSDRDPKRPRELLQNFQTRIALASLDASDRIDRHARLLDEILAGPSVGFAARNELLSKLPLEPARHARHARARPLYCPPNIMCIEHR